MFNFFDEIKRSTSRFKQDILNRYNLVFISGKILYAEGVKSLSELSNSKISFFVTGGKVIVEGSNLVLQEFEEGTLKVVGDIVRVEEER